MGLDFIRAKAKRFEQQRDKSKSQEFDVADLLSRAKNDRFVPFFRCQLDNLDTALVVGLGLVGRAYSEISMAILQRGKTIAQMLPEDAGVITLIVVQEAGIDGVFVVKAKKSFKLQA